MGGHPSGIFANRPRVHVLVVDDDQAIRTSVAEILRDAGYTTAEAEDGLAALELMRVTDVGVLVTDVEMPRLDGLGLLNALDDPPPVVLMSAQPRVVDARGVRAVFSYLQKPVKPLVLLDAVVRAGPWPG